MDPGGVPCARQELGVLTIGPRITRSLGLSKLDRVDGEVVYEGEPFFSLQQPTPVVRDPGHGGLDLGVQDCVFRMPSTSPRRLRPAMSIHPYQFLWVLLVSSLGIVVFDRDVGWAVLERGGLQRNGRYGAAWVRGHVLER